MKTPCLSHVLSTFVLVCSALGATHCGGSSDGNAGNEDGGNEDGGNQDHGNSHQFSLSVSITGIGLGTVHSSVGNLQCAKSGGTCSANIDASTVVTLSATPDPGYVFNGWLDSGCHGTGTCQITLNQAESVRASFVNIAYFSNRDLDPTKNQPTNPVAKNIWLANTDGTHSQALAGIVATGLDSELPGFSPDGNQLVFISNRKLDGSPALDANGGRNLWVVNADGSGLRSLAGLDVQGVQVDYNNPRWSPDASGIVFVSNQNINGSPTPNTSGGYNIWVVDSDGNHPRVLAGLDVASVTSNLPVWSPDGTKIAFESNRNTDLTPTLNPSGQYNIWVMNSDGSGLHPLTQLRAQGADAEWPQWSPDGSQIVFVSNRSLSSDPAGPMENANNLWKMNADGSNPVALTHDTGSAPNGAITNRNPQWSPDGRLITFESNQDPNHPMPSGPSVIYNIWAVATDGNQPPYPLAPLTGQGIFSEGPYWAPDSSLVIFTSNRKLDNSNDMANPNINLWIVRPDGSAAMPITDLLTPAFADSAFNLD